MAFKRQGSKGQTAQGAPSWTAHLQGDQVGEARLQGDQVSEARLRGDPVGVLVQKPVCSLHGTPLICFLVIWFTRGGGVPFKITEINSNRL